MQAEKVKVLYIAGFGRNGSTLLCNILGQQEGLFSVGELRWIWSRGLIENELCGCGQPFKECLYWQAIIREAFGGFEGVDAINLEHVRKESNRTRHLPGYILIARNARGEPLQSEYLRSLEQLYRAIQKVTQSRVIVDASKVPTYGYQLDSLPSVNTYIVHLVRDSRAVAFSWLRKKIRPENRKLMVSFNPWKSAALWLIWNLSVEILWNRRKKVNRYLRVRYEDLVSCPKVIVKHILHFVGEEVKIHQIEGHTIELMPTHTVSGNPMRFQQGSVELQIDIEWQKRMRLRDKILVTILTWPLLIRYGYLGRNTDIFESTI